MNDKGMNRSRRAFLGDVGRGMLVAGVGPFLATELGIAMPLDDSDPGALTFGDLEPLVSLMQETPVDRLQPKLAEKLRGGVDLKTLVTAGVLANARSFGGEDYVGYHAMMALMPAYEMAHQLKGSIRALPVFKVLYRNTARIQASGKVHRPTLHRVDAKDLPKGAVDAQLLRKQMRSRNLQGAERTFAKLVREKPMKGYNALQPLIQDGINVHRVVLAWRAWDILQLTGFEHAHTLLRQSVRFCIDEEKPGRDKGIRKVLPRLMDEYDLLNLTPGNRRADDRWIERMTSTIFSGSRARAAEAVAAALQEGFSPEAIGEAMSLAATRLVLHDPGRRDDAPGKPRGSVHGASVGVHAADSVNAWRNISRVTDTRNTIASLVVGAFHTAGQKGRVGDRPFPYMERLEDMRRSEDPDSVLTQLRDAVTSNDQAGASALVHHYSSLGHPEKPVFDLLLEYAVSEDGALHAEKYYRTVGEEFESTRKSHRWQHLVALARVTASEFGHPAPGRDQARQLLRNSY